MSNDPDNQTRPQPAPWLFAHRGTSTLAPENTAAAFDIARSARADVLEIDVRISHDQNVIVTHDASVVRTTNGSGLVADQSINELKALDAGYRYATPENDTPWRGQGVTLLTLAELFQSFPDIGVNIDIKDAQPQAAEVVARELRRIADGRWLNVGSFHQKSIDTFRRCAPEISTAASQWDVAALYFGRWFPAGIRRSMIEKSGGQVLQIPQRWSGLSLDSANFIRFVQQQHRLVMYWTINDPEDMRSLLARRANGIVSDNVLIAREVIDHFVEQDSK